MKIARSLFALALFFPMLAGAQDKPAATPGPSVQMQTYRLIFTLTDSEGGKKIGVQHVTMVTTSQGLSAIAKVGSRIPIVTGSYQATGSKEVQTQFTYLDIGVNILARVHDYGYGIGVTTKIEQSTMADAPPATPQDPIIRQASIDNDAVLTVGKAMTLGSLDITGSTRHTEVELLVERVP